MCMRKTIFGVVLAVLLALAVPALGTPVTISVYRGADPVHAYVEVWNATPRLGGKLLDRDKLIASGMAPLNASLEANGSYIIYAVYEGTTYEFHFPYFKPPEDGQLKLVLTETYWRSSMKLVLVLAGAVVFLVFLALFGRGRK